MMSVKTEQENVDVHVWGNEVDILISKYQINQIFIIKMLINQFYEIATIFWDNRVVGLIMLTFDSQESLHQNLWADNIFSMFANMPH